MRLVTRADLDGLTCAILLREVEPIDEIEFAHPKDVQDGKVASPATTSWPTSRTTIAAGCGSTTTSSQADAFVEPEMRGRLTRSRRAPRASSPTTTNRRSSTRFDELLEADRPRSTRRS